jgi:AraC family transcriptional regulator of adaptative response / DNA-3-methyladenine glycosylase II
MSFQKASASINRRRRLLDLDADAGAITDQLGVDPVLGPLIAAWPGVRVPGAADGFEIAVRAVVGQQVSVAGARTVLARLVRTYGKPVTSSESGPVGFHFPTPDALAAADPTTLPMPRARGRTLVRLAAAVADGQLSLDAGADRSETTAALLAFPGIGPWTAAYVRMRALGDPDVLLTTDLGVRRAAERLGLDGSPAGLERLGAAWAPWRSYATHYLWHVIFDRPATDVGTTL